MKLTKPQRRALEILKKHTWGKYCGRFKEERQMMHVVWFAREMWPDSPSWERYSNCGRSGARTATGIMFKAGQFLWALHRRGWACMRITDHGQCLFAISRKGVNALEAPDVTT